MLIYQVRIAVAPDHERQWLNWMRTVHVPDVIATGLVSSFQIWTSKEEPHVYCYNYYFEKEIDFDQYQDRHAPGLKRHPQETFPGAFSATRKIYHQL